MGQYLHVRYLIIFGCPGCQSQLAKCFSFLVIDGVSEGECIFCCVNTKLAPCDEKSVPLLKWGGNLFEQKRNPFLIQQQQQKISTKSKQVWQVSKPEVRFLGPLERPSATEKLPFLFAHNHSSWQGGDEEKFKQLNTAYEVPFCLTFFS